MDGDFEALKEYVSERLEIKRNRIRYLNLSYYLARAYKELGEKEKAVEVLEASVSSDADSSYIGQNLREIEQRYELGEAYYENGQYEEARQQYLSCIYFGNLEKRQIAIKALSHLIKCEIKMEHIDGAKEHLCMLRSIEPFDDETKLWKLQIEVLERKIKKRAR
jgi:tetratricopeptide (TPR) repeat protein